MLALALYEASLCQCGCNMPRDVAHDPKGLFITDHEVCRASAVLAAARRDFEESKKAEKHRDERWMRETSGGRNLPSKPRPTDGVIWTVAPYEPETAEVVDQ